MRSTPLKCNSPVSPVPCSRKPEISEIVLLNSMGFLLTERTALWPYVSAQVSRPGEVCVLPLSVCFMVKVKELRTIGLTYLNARKSQKNKNGGAERKQEPRRQDKDRAA